MKERLRGERPPQHMSQTASPVLFVRKSKTRCRVWSHKEAKNIPLMLPTPLWTVRHCKGFCMNCTQDCLASLSHEAAEKSQSFHSPKQNQKNCQHQVQRQSSKTTSADRRSRNRVRQIKAKQKQTKKKHLLKNKFLMGSLFKVKHLKLQILKANI